LARWDKELNGFALFETLKEEGKSLFAIYERLRAEHTDLLILHHEYLENQYIDHKINLTRAKKRKAVIGIDSDESDTETDNDGHDGTTVARTATAGNETSLITGVSSSSRDGASS